MSEVSKMTDEELAHHIWYFTSWPGRLPGPVPKYCTDPSASLEVQTAAIARDRDEFLNNLTGVAAGYYPKSINWDIEWENDVIALLLTATPRQRAEAAYMTLKGE
jgi:hypothetical protein